MKILFITHEASRTGAPIVLLNLLKWLSVNQDIPFETVCLRPGEIVQDFKELGQVHIIDRENLLVRGLRRVFGVELGRVSRLSLLSRRLASEGFDMIYANTVVSIRAALYLAHRMERKPKIIAHVHEGRLSLNEFAPEFRELSPAIDRFIAASGLVASNLKRMGVDSKRIQVIYPFSTPQSRRARDGPVKSSQRLTIGGSGLVNWRKGTDMFLMVANHCRLHFPELDLEFVWVGKVPEREREIIEEDLRKCSLGNVWFVGQTDEPEKYFNQFDLFLMTSREDPFPLVCIESGYLSVPVICFDGATGTQEMLGEGGGSVVPYMDIQSMAESIKDYYQNRKRLAADGEVARRVFSEFTPDKMCPKIHQAIMECFSGGNV